MEKSGRGPPHYFRGSKKMKCYYLGEFEANVDEEPFVTEACFHPASGTTVDSPVDCPAVYGNPCLFEGGPFEGPDKNYE